MMKQFSILAGIALFPLFLSAQTDTLYTLADTARARQLLEEATKMMGVAGFDAALERLEKAEKIYKQTLGEENELYAKALLWKGMCLTGKEDYGRAIDITRKAVAIQLKTVGAELPDVAISYNNLGNIDYSKGNYDRAVDFHQKALAIRLKSLGDLHPQTANSYYNLGNIYNSKGEYDQALEYHQKALTIRLKVFGAEHQNVAPSYNNLGTVYELKGEYDRALECHQKALTIRSKTLGPEHPNVAMSYNNLGNIYRSKGDYDQALEYYPKALAIYRKKLSPEHPHLAGIMSNIGGVYEFKGDYDRAIEYSLKALAIQMKNLGAEHRDVALSYNNLGSIYKAKGDYERALDFHQKAIAIQLKALEPEHDYVATSYNNLGKVYEAKGDYDRALDFHQKALAIQIKKLGPEHPRVAVSYNDLGNVYNAKSQYDEATECYKRALAVWLKTLGKEHRDIAGVYNNLGNVYYEKGDYDQAMEYCQTALNIRLKSLGAEHPDVAGSYANLGLVFYSKGDFAQSIEYYKKAADIRLKIFGAENPKVAETYQYMLCAYGKQLNFTAGEPMVQRSLQALLYTNGSSLSRVNSLPVLIEALNNEGKFYQDWHTRSRNISHLLKARQSYFEADAAIAYQRHHLESRGLGTGSKTTLAKDATGIYEGAIAANHLLRQLTDSLSYWREAFDYAEKSKSLLLYEAMRGADALHFAGLPDDLLQKEYDLRVDITYNEKKRHDMLAGQKLSETDTAVLLLSGKLFNLHQAYDDLQKHFELRYPQYFQLKYDLSVAGIEEVQQSLLQPNQTLVEYFAGDSSIFIFVVDKQRFKVIEVKKDFTLEDWVAQFRRSLVENYSTRTAEYCDLAYRLYERLLLPAKDLLTNELVIIPDGVLGYLPFEALLVEKPGNPIRFKDHHYLLRDYRVSYCYSATLLREMLQKQHRQAPQHTLLAFAPFYDGDTSLMAKVFSYTDEVRKDLQPLPHSGAEVHGISKIMNGEAFYKAEATEEHFVELAGGYRILHLATHGQANDREGDYSFLAFTEIKDSLENELLYVRDLYNLSLNADLVTLSACETGIGKLERGEGIISLARAFTYAGAKSIVTSLWSVKDEPTKELMLRFYRHLKKGLPKDEALRQAKLDYLAKCAPEKAHPFFWAGFVGVGDMGALGF